MLERRVERKAGGGEWFSLWSEAVERGFRIMRFRDSGRKAHAPLKCVGKRTGRWNTHRRNIGRRGYCRPLQVSCPNASRRATDPGG